MKASFVSNMSLQNAMRITVSKAQKEMLQRQEETVTGRHADVGAEVQPDRRGCSLHSALGGKAFANLGKGDVRVQNRSILG